MAFIVGDSCVKCKLTDCVEVCPVDCFYEGENFLAIKPDFPIPAKITLPLQFKIRSTAFMKELLKTFLIFFNSLI